MKSWALDSVQPAPSYPDEPAISGKLVAQQIPIAPQIPVAPRAPAPPGPIESFSVNTRRMEPDVETIGAPRASNDNALPLNEPIATNRALSAFSPERVTPRIGTFRQPTLYANSQGGVWPTIDGARSSLILEGEILPPAPVARSESQVGQSRPVIDLQANGSEVLTPTRGITAPSTQEKLDRGTRTPTRAIAYEYKGVNALGLPKVVFNLDVVGNNALVSMRSADGVTIPSVEEVESLLKQLLALRPEVNALSAVQIPGEKSLVIARPSVRPLPALENILQTGPTLYVNSAGVVWPSLASAQPAAQARPTTGEFPNHKGCG